MINQTMRDYLDHHEQILKHWLAKAIIPSEHLRDAMFYSLFPGGKRLRPMLVYLSGEILEANQSCLDIIAAAIEFTHCYSLIHDDLPAMDNDDMRRGKPSCHKAFDEATAILAGDGMQTLAIEILLNNLPSFLSAEQVIVVIRELIHASGTAGMVSGQSFDLSELTKPDIQESQLRLIHSLKTGKLISACIKMVIAATNPATKIANALINYAGVLGLVFQMQDDYLDHYADQMALGKDRASDLANHKITYATLYPQAELLKMIITLYQNAKEELYPLGQSAENLLMLTDILQKRSNQGG